ncbi:MAG: serine--tRNA ligase [Vampirovibrionales bacterium]|nr:serine--tRNA ligase [Vampirovibrionales bacterium]
MLDIRWIRQDAEAVNAGLKRRSLHLSVDAIVALDNQRLALLQEEETLRSQRNALSKEVGQRKSKGENADELMAQTKAIAERIKILEADKDALEVQQNALLLDIPNIPSMQSPVGADENANVEVRRWGDELKNRAPKDALAHWDLGPAMGMLDFERGVKVAQSRFTLQRGWGAKLSRALINFMLDTHEGLGYEELRPPYLVNADAMKGTGQLPKFEADMFRCQDDALYLIPTAEVPVTNLYANEVLLESQLPFCFSAYTPCFRREAGSAGRDTRGFIRQHQFDKVELVKLTTAEQAEAEHLKLVADAERILQLLELPYRAMELCTGDMGFSAQRCFDLEVWLPGQQAYREISSCSHFGDFQARRAGLKYRSEATNKLEWCHTINGSGLAIGRTVVAILENYQLPPDAQGRYRVAVPTVLQPYLKTEILEATEAVHPFGVVESDSSLTLLQGAEKGRVNV